MLLAVVAILGFSLACIHSATHGTNLKGDFTEQMLMVGPAIGILAIVATYGYEWLRPAAKYIYILNLAALAAVIVVGHSALGAQRWISLAGFRFQPSEFAKLALIITLAKVLSERNVHSPDGILTVLGTVAVPALLIFKQPDLGTALVYGAIALGMLYWAGLPASALFKVLSPLFSAGIFALGIRWWLLYVVMLGGMLVWTRRQHWLVPASLWGVNVLCGVAASKVWGMLKDYQKKRILTFL
ncbi:MAG: FtsW/RodA/SpoVE family cell cycle protein, partial [Cyanobacteria bacterium REEB65]|nr:FtsW/RodA/SpoVE family cell cycle protein [Cyanobacteria bacterium REEB65]